MESYDLIVMTEYSIACVNEMLLIIAQILLQHHY